MKRKLLIFLSFIAGISAGYSQIVTPFTPSSRDENGKRVYVKPQENYRRTSLSIGYGYGSLTMMDWYANKNAETVNVGNLPVNGELTSRAGMFSFGIGREINPWLEFEFSFMLGFAEGKFTNYIGYPEANYKETWYVFMPGMRINWMRNNWLAVYSKASAGMALHRRDEFTSVHSTDRPPSRKGNDKGALAWHLSPVGIEAGKGCVNFFVEGGYGYRGFVFAGLKFKLGSGSGGSGRQWDSIVYPPM